MKKILAIIEYFPPRLGGDKRIFELLRRLPKEYIVNFLVLPPSYVSFLKKIERKKPEFKYLVHEGMIGIQLDLPAPLFYLWDKNIIIAYLLTMLYLLVKASIVEMKVKADIIIVNNTSVYTGLLGRILSIITRKPLLVDFNDLESEYSYEQLKDHVNNSFLRRILKTMLRLVEDFILRGSCNVVTTHTLFLKKYLEVRGFDKKIIHVPDGVDTSLFNPNDVDENAVEELKRKLGIKTNERICVYTGRIDRNTGGEILLKTIALFESNKYDNVRFIIVGEGDPELVDKICSFKNTICLGLRPFNEIPLYLALADVVLVPFPSTVASQSVSPLKLFEALSMGKVVVASKVYGIMEVIVDRYNGILVSDNAEEWFEAILEVLYNKKIRENISRRALKTGRKYDWNVLSRKFLTAINGCIQKCEARCNT